jgi:zinc protease
MLVAGCSGPASRRSSDLPNGLRVVFDSSDSPIVCALFFMDFGEVDGPPGLATLTNRLLLRGTEIRNGQQLAEEIEILGGRIGAETDFTSSIVWIQSIPERFDECFALLCECLTRSTFDSAEVVRMQKQLGNERVVGKSLVSEKSLIASERIRARLYAEPAFSRNPLDALATVPYSTSQVKDFYLTFHRPERMVLTVSGKIPGRSVLNTVRRLWTDKAVHDSIASVLEPAVRVQGEDVERVKGTRDTVFIAYRAGITFSEPFADAMVIQNALARTGKGPLAVRLERNGIRGVDLRSVFQFETRYAYGAVLVIVPPGDGPAARRIALESLEAFRNGTIEIDAVEPAKRKLESTLAILSQYSLNQAYYCGLAASIKSPMRSLEAAQTAVQNRLAEDILRSSKDILSGAKVWTVTTR